MFLLYNKINYLFSYAISCNKSIGTFIFSKSLMGPCGCYKIIFKSTIFNYILFFIIKMVNTKKF